MKFYRLIFAIAVFAVLMQRNTVLSDEVWLKNGDHVKGVVVSMEANKLIFKTSYADDMTIAWSEVSNICTDAPIKVLFSDDTSAQGVIISGEDRKITLKSEQMLTPLTFQLTQIKGINPSPPAPPVLLSGRINMGININDGNTDTKTYYGDAELVARSEKNRFTLGGRYNRAEDSGDTTVDNQTGYIQYDHFLTDKWYLLANAAGTKDSFKDLNLRSSFGLGMGYQFGYQF